MLAPFAAALAAIDGVFGETVSYTGAGLTAGPVTAIRTDMPADDMVGFNGKDERTSFEIARSALPGRPAKGDAIVAGGESWTVIDVGERRDIARWLLAVRK